MSYPYPREKGPSAYSATLLGLKWIKSNREKKNKGDLVKWVQTYMANHGVKVIPSYDSVTRISRKIMEQEKYEELRGTDWQRNQVHARRSVQKQIEANTFGKKNPSDDLGNYIGQYGESI